MSLSCGEYFTKKIKVLEDVNKCFKSGFDIDVKEVDSRIKTDYLQLPNVSTGYKIKTVFEKRKVIKILTDNIYQSSTLWLPENWNFKLESFKKIDFFWGKLSEVIVTQSSVVSMKPARKNVNNSEQLIKLDSHCKIAEVNSPAKVSARGRPKEASLTVIGLPKASFKLIPFTQKNTCLQVVDLLNWLKLLQTVVNTVLRREYVIKAKDISQICKPEQLKDSLINGFIDLGILKEYFDEESLQILSQAIKLKKNSNIGLCKNCNGTFLLNISKKIISCDNCLKNYHYHCVSIKQKSQPTWFCSECVEK